MSAVPTERSGFVPPPGFGHRHLQSMLSTWSFRYAVLRRRAARLLEAATPELVDGGDGIRLLGLLSVQPMESRGLVIMLHGWEGCADSSYMLSTGAVAFNEGFDVLRLNFRDHGNTQALNEGLFHSCRIDEVANAVSAVLAHRRPRVAVLLGHSLGGNFAVRVALRAHNGIALDRVLAVCPVLRPHSTMQALEEGFWVYRYYFLRRWRASLESKAAAFPELYRFGDLRRFATLTATTDFFVREYTPFASLDDYLHGYSIVGAELGGLEVPTRLIMAADDPVIPIGDVAALERSDALTVDVQARGGHCAFLDSYRLTSWVDTQVVAELRRL